MRSNNTLGRTTLIRSGRTPSTALPTRSYTRQSWNAGVNQAYRQRLPVKTVRPDMQHYYNAGVYTAYGNLSAAKLQLGDLFNDVMGAVVPGWDQRPDWMKRMVVKPDPAKLVQTAQQVAPNAAGKIVTAAEKAGLNIFVNTPGGQVPVTPGMAQSLYEGYPLIARTRTALGEIPTWVWIAVPGGILALVLLSRK